MKLRLLTAHLLPCGGFLTGQGLEAPCHRVQIVTAAAGIHHVPLEACSEKSLVHGPGIQHVRVRGGKGTATPATCDKEPRWGHLAEWEWLQLLWGWGGQAEPRPLWVEIKGRRTEDEPWLSNCWMERLRLKGFVKIENSAVTRC